MLHPISSFRPLLLRGCATLTIAAFAALPEPARASDCLLDTNNDGQVTVNSTSSGGFVTGVSSPDTDLGATSGSQGGR